MPRVRRRQKISHQMDADVASKAALIKVGSQDEEGVEMGSLISAKQRSRVAGFVDRARTRAAA